MRFTHGLAHSSFRIHGTPARLLARAVPSFPNIAAVQLKWGEVEKEQVEFVNRVTNESLEKMVPFRKTQITLMHLMQHLATPLRVRLQVRGVMERAQ